MLESRRAESALRDPDHRVYRHGVSWEDFEKILSIRGDCGGPRITYRRGELELLSPSRSREGIKTTLARILYAYAALVTRCIDEAETQTEAVRRFLAAVRTP